MSDLSAPRDEAYEFHRFFSEYYPTILNTLYVRTRNWAEAEDLTQDTFLCAAKSFQRQEVQPSLSWAVTIARNIYKNWLRHGHASKRSGQEEPLDGNDRLLAHLHLAYNNQEDQLIAQQRVYFLKRAIAALPLKMGYCFHLFFLQDCPYAQIAEHMGTSVQTVKSQVSRARKKVMTSIQQFEQSATP